MIELNVNQLKAAAEIAPSKDIRYYLCGVLFEVTASGDVHLVATDGSMMFAGKVSEECTQKGPFALIIPIDTVKLAVKTKRPSLTLAALPDGRYSLGDTIFSPVEGRFPDWRRVWMVKPTDDTATTAQVDPELLLRAQTAMRHWFNGKKDSRYFVQHNGPANQAHIFGPDNSAGCVVMPMRGIERAKYAAPFTPAAYGA